MSYFSPVRSAELGMDGFDLARVDDAPFEHQDSRDQVEREPCEGGARSERRERRAFLDEIREFRRGDGREREREEFEPERDPRRFLL